MAIQRKSVMEPPKKYYHLIPLIIILAFIPLIARYHQYDNMFADFSWFSSMTELADVFLYYKSIAFILVSVFMFFAIVLKLFISETKPRLLPIFIALGAYILLAFLSSVISPYRKFAFSGTYDQFESIWVILGYGIAVCYAYLFIQDEQDVKFLMRCFKVGIFLMVMIGLSQAFGQDFWGTSLGRSIITSNPDLKNRLDFEFEVGRVYMSLYNPNYVGSYGALIIPILLCNCLFLKPNILNKRDKIIHIVDISSSFLLLIGLFACLYKSESKSGLISLVIAMVILIILIFFKNIKYWYFGVIGLFILIFAFIIINRSMNYMLTRPINDFINMPQTTYKLQDIKLSSDNVAIMYNDHELILSIDETSDTPTLVAYDENAIPINLVKVIGEDLTYGVQGDNYGSFVISLYPIGGNLSMDVNISGTHWIFSKINDTYEYRNLYNKWSIFTSAPSSLFTGRERIASGRGYIWSRTIPLLKNNMILGSGADSFTLVFPNDDYVYKYNTGYLSITGDELLDKDMIFTKPHNLYLQIGVQTGVLSLIAFLAFNAIFFYISIKTFFITNITTYNFFILLGILIGIFAYLITGFINDSTITVAPIYWVLIGVGTIIHTTLSNNQHH